MLISFLVLTWGTHRLSFRWEKQDLAWPPVQSYIALTVVWLMKINSPGSPSAIHYPAATCPWNELSRGFHLASHQLVSLHSDLLPCDCFQMKSPKSVLFWVGNIWNHFPKRAWHLPTIIPLCNLKYIISLIVPSIWSAALLYPCSHSSGNKEISRSFQDWTKTAVPRSTSAGPKYPAIYNVQRLPLTISKRQEGRILKVNFIF